MQRVVCVFQQTRDNTSYLFFLLRFKEQKLSTQKKRAKAVGKVTDLPPVQPVLTNHALVPCSSIFSASMEAYFMGCHNRKAPPKHALKVASGSVMPCSVPATCICVNTDSQPWCQLWADQQKLGQACSACASLPAVNSLLCCVCE